MNATAENLGAQYKIADFTISEYVDLLRIAKLNYKFIDYESIDLSTNFILWRHDCDFSLNRAFALLRLRRIIMFVLPFL